MAKIFVVIATSNAHKLREFEMMLSSRLVSSDYSVCVASEALGEYIPPAEVGESYWDISLSKAVALQEKLLQKGAGNCCVLADDSGLEVEALDGAPGVYSARYAGVKAKDSDNVIRLLEAMQEYKHPLQRKARMVSVVSLVFGDICLQSMGVMEGIIALQPSHAKGFGYDPVFIPSSASAENTTQMQENTITLAGMSLHEKNHISHRHQALVSLLAYEKLFTSG